MKRFIGFFLTVTLIAAVAVCAGTAVSRAAATTCPDGNHSLSDWRLSQPGTCNQAAVEERHCENILSTGKQCLYKELRTTVRDPENHAGLYLKNKKEPTCAVEGYTGDTYCSLCHDADLNDTLVSIGEVIAPTGHRWGEWTVEHEATCIIRGTLTRACQNCGKTDTVSLLTDAGAHMAEPVKADIAPTCTEDGSAGRMICPYCMAETDPGVPIPAYGHVFEEWTVLVPATCSAQGTEQAICTVCGAVENRKTPYDPGNHNGRTRLSGAKNPDCDSAGYTGDTVCSGCSAVLEKGETLPMLGHSFGGWTAVSAATCAARGKDERICSVCGSKQTRETDFAPDRHTGRTKISGSKRATCDNAGYTGDTVCYGCGEILVYGQTIPFSDHTFGAWTTTAEATCSTQGRQERICSVCGDKQTRTTEYDPENHTGKTRVTGAKAADCDSAGYTGDTVCYGCGTVIEKGEIIAATGHSFGKWKTTSVPTCSTQGTNERTCSVCGKVETAKTAKTVAHTYGGWTTVTEANCSTQGKQERVCTICGDAETKTTGFNPDVHINKTKVTGAKTADCDSSGYTGDTVCYGCGTVIEKGEIIAATGHSFGKWKATSVPTCSSQGTNERTCSVCGKTETAKTAKTVAHTYGDWTTITEANCSTQGKQERVCTICGDAETKTTGFNPDVHINKTKVTGAKTADCDSSGYTGDTVCYGCGTVISKGEIIAATGHSFGKWKATSVPTCSSQGTNERTCSVCGKTETAKTAKTIAHTYGGWTTVTEANCSTQGRQERVCSVCGDTETKTTGFNPDVHINKTKVTGAKAADCDSAGYTGDSVCYGCGTVISKGEVIAATGHSFGKWKTTSAPTCSSQGTNERTCSVCGKVETAKTAKTVAHTYGDWTTVTEANCSTQGRQERVCSVCGDTETKTIGFSPNVHINKTKVTGAKAADCDSAGYTGDTVCYGCGTVVEKGKTVTATGHSFGKWKVIKAATCSSQGTEERTCSVCGKVETAKTAKTIAHTYGGWTTVTEANCATQGKQERVCSVCGDTETRTTGFNPDVHINKTKVTGAKAADCDSAGYTGDTVCYGCGTVISKGEVIAATGHSFGRWKAASVPTCSSQGTNERTCSVCGKVETAKTAKTIAHTYGGWTTVTEANCATQGKQERVCSVCGDTETKTTGFNPDVHINKTKVTGAKAADCDSAGYTGDTVCYGCGTVISKGEVIAATGHSFGKWKATSVPTCSSQGTNERTCSVCGKVETAKTAKTVAHTYGGWTIVTEANCATQGKQERVCAVCGDTETRTTGFDPDVHINKTKVTGAKAADCDTAGYTGDTVCYSCGTTLKRGDPIPAAGHRYGGWTTVTAADCASQGKQERSCAVCGGVQTRLTEYDPSNHTGKTKVTGAKAADCDTAGYTGDTVCYGCSAVLKQGRTVPATGHRYGSWNVTRAATCAAQGTEERTCSVCGKTDTEKTPRTASHVYGGWTAVTEANCSTQGKQERVCSVCGDRETQTTGYDPSVHSGRTRVAGIKAPGCDTAGYTGNTVCQGCGEILSYGVSVAAAGHVFGEWTVAKAPTCAAAGARRRVCSVCGDPETQPLEKDRANHSGTEKTVGAKAPSCTGAGYSGDTVCSACGETVRRGTQLPASGHAFGEWVVSAQPTPERDGIANRACSVCGTKETKVIAYEGGAGGSAAGDLNGDGTVNAEDLRLMLRAVNGVDKTDDRLRAKADLNSDGKIDRSDLDILKKRVV